MRALTILSVSYERAEQPCLLRGSIGVQLKRSMTFKLFYRSAAVDEIAVKQGLNVLQVLPRQ